jgi:hypothetical protein
MISNIPSLISDWNDITALSVVGDGRNTPSRRRHVRDCRRAQSEKTLDVTDAGPRRGGRSRQ